MKAEHKRLLLVLTRQVKNPEVLGRAMFEWMKRQKENAVHFKGGLCVSVHFGQK